MTRYSAVLATALVMTGAADAAAQDIGALVRQANNGTVRLTFAARPGVCGDGETFIATRGWTDDPRERRTIFRESKGSYNISTGSGDWLEQRDCEEGDARVALTVENGQVTDVRSYVGKSWPAGQRAHTVSARNAAAYLLQVVETGSTHAAKRALTPIIIADSVQPTPDLLRIARQQSVSREVRKSAIFWAGQFGEARVGELSSFITDRDDEVAKSALFAISQQRTDEAARTLIGAARNRDLATEVRKSAVFWLGQVASERATEGLKQMIGDENTEVKKSAVFALSQIKTEKSLDALIDLARNSKDREVRKSALFWLGQSNDPRALALFEEILLKK